MNIWASKAPLAGAAVSVLKLLQCRHTRDRHSKTKTQHNISAYKKNKMQQRLNVNVTKNQDQKFLFYHFIVLQNIVMREKAKNSEKIVIPTNLSTRIGAGHTCFIKNLKAASLI